MVIPDPSEEVVLPVGNTGWELRTGGTERTSGEYVRLVDPDSRERYYWDQEEWRDDPATVMGAILNSAVTLSGVG